jgi:6-pyruvoyltetrahydropterin/6-carboxytetrahydropterin synthase
MAHALHQYDGDCKYIHGHSYELHVTVRPINGSDEYIKAPGIPLDFKELKNIVKISVIDKLDHKLLLSKEFIKEQWKDVHDNLFTFEAEPSAENLLVYITNLLKDKLPAGMQLIKLKLFETRDSYAEWIAGSE